MVALKQLWPDFLPVVRTKRFTGNLTSAVDLNLSADFRTDRLSGTHNLAEVVESGPATQRELLLLFRRQGRHVLLQSFHN